MKSLASSAFTAAALLASTALAIPAGRCPVENEICYQVGVPPASAQSGQGNIYFQIAALTTYSWVALGTGSQMAGSNIFVMYQDGNGNVTISPRTGRGHSQPQAQTQTRLQLLAGSGVSDGIMRANVLCQNCQSWTGGEMSLSSSDSNWIGAWRKGNALNSASVSQSIQQHQGDTAFSFDLSQASITADSNPFIEGAGGNSNNNGNNNNGSNNNNGGGNSDSLGGNNNGSGGSTSTLNTINLFLVHGIIMAVVFVFMYPVGAILMPMVGKWYIHAAWQMLAFVGMWVGFGIGISQNKKEGREITDSHTILGTVVVCAMVFQPVLGFLHHNYFKKHEQRGPISHAHIWYGRVLMLVGIVNGGLGLKLANSSNNFVLAYAILASMFGVAYIASGYIGATRKRGPRREKDAFASPRSEYREGRQVQYAAQFNSQPQQQQAEYYGSERAQNSSRSRERY